MKITTAQIKDTSRVYYVDSLYEILPSNEGASYYTQFGTLFPYVSSGALTAGQSIVSPNALTYVDAHKTRRFSSS